MHVFEEFDVPTRVIMHFREDEEFSGGRRLIYYQVTIDPDPSWYSPDGQFIRFNHQDGSEVHGWVKVDSVVIDSVLAVEEAGEWKVAANG